MKVLRIPVSQITADPNQPRKDFDAEGIEELASSIKANGLLQPITVGKNGDGYTIIAGERRFRASQLLGQPEVECIVYTGDKAVELQLVENINRVDLNPIEVAEAYRRYLDAGHTVEELSEVVGKNQAQVTWSLNLLRLNDDAKHLAKRGQLPIAVAGYMSKLSVEGQKTALRTMLSQKLSGIECRKLCEAIALTENQGSMLAEDTKLTPREQDARQKAQSAIEKACKAFEEINRLETDTPGITAQAVADKLDITMESVEMLQKLLGRFKNSLAERRVRELC